MEAFVNGFAISHRLPQNTTRSQRAFIRLAKGKRLDLLSFSVD